MALDLNYVAGIIDGEGYIGFDVLKKRNGNVYMYGIITVMMGHQSLIRLLYEQFGGSFLALNDNRKNKSKMYRWRIKGKQAAEFLTLITPLLFVKSAQASVVKQFQDLNDNARVDAEIINNFKNLLQSLNAREYEKSAITREKV